MGKLLSVIVPIYNSEQYLARCIESILGQKYRNIEVILLDDGSNDKSGEICDEFAQKDPRVIVFHDQNRGLSAVRSFGMSKATGDLVTFVDSDDWIEENMYFEMMEVEKQYQPDIISSGMIYDNDQTQGIENDIFERGLYDRKLIENRVLPIMMYNPKCGSRAVNSSVCNKIFQKKLLIEIMRNLNKELTYGEDAAITYLCIAKANSIMFVGTAWYHYCPHQGSMSASFDVRSFEKIKKFADYMEVEFKKMGIWESMWYQLKQYIKLFLIPAIQVIYGIDLSERQYRFPFELISRGSRIVIYGAGNVGKSYFKRFYDSNYGEIAGWVDKNYQSISRSGYYVTSPDEIRDMTFDYIVIAIEKENVAQNVKTFLNSMAIPIEKIVWTKPIKAN